MFEENVVEATLSNCFCHPYEKGSTLNRKNLLLLGEYFPLLEQTISDSIFMQESKLKVTKAVSIEKEMA